MGGKRVEEPDWSKRPRPAVTLDTKFWWDGLRAGELRIQRCSACGGLQHPPEPFCPLCGGDDLSWIVARGTGLVHSFVVYHEPRIPGFAYPYVVALVELAEGTRVVANLEEIDPTAVEIDQPVRVTFREIDDELTLPVFVPEDAAGKPAEAGPGRVP
jgi:uncharacterized OB-fold protein